MDRADTYIQNCVRLAAAGIEPPLQARNRLMRAAQLSAWLAQRPLSPACSAAPKVSLQPARLPPHLQFSCWMPCIGFTL